MPYMVQDLFGGPSDHLENQTSTGSRNKTLSCSAAEILSLSAELLKLKCPAARDDLENKVICQDFFDAVSYLPAAFVDLLILDPPYNLTKNYNGNIFSVKKDSEYESWFEKMIVPLKPLLKKTASVYVCADWRTSVIIAPILNKHFKVQNRITWEREKGRGAERNWKNNLEDIWFCTVGSKDYYYNAQAVKIKKRVVAPYKTNGQPRDWQEQNGKNFRLTYHSNIWTDITIPFFSMRENTPHPTQKSEKLFAKLMLASSKENDMVFDPFGGSGTAAVVAKKLNRRYLLIENNREYCCWGLKRLNLSTMNTMHKRIQGFTGGVFWERNTLSEQIKTVKSGV